MWSHLLLAPDHDVPLPSKGDAFVQIDANNDGLIDLQEFTAALQKQGISNKQDIKKYFEAINQDGTGKIKYSEFVAAELDQSTTLTDAQIDAAFHRMDFDNSGSISAQEVHHMMHDTYGGDASAEVAKIMKEADTNGDGVIDINEFRVAVRRASLVAEEKSPGRDRRSSLVAVLDSPVRKSVQNLKAQPRGREGKPPLW